MPNLVEVRKAEPGQLPFTVNTVRKLHSMKRYPGIIFKVGSLLYFDLAEWDHEVERERKRSIRESEQVNRRRDI